MSWIWLAQDVILAVHEEQLAEHGGAPGVRSLDLLQSALARPRNLTVYAEADAAALAATYAYGIARNHPFVDGNKRSAFVALELFLNLNGLTLAADDADCVAMTLGLAAGEIDEETLADWVRRRLGDGV